MDGDKITVVYKNKNSQKAWGTFKEDFKRQYGKENNMDLTSLLAWEEYKGKRGRLTVKIFRSMAVASLLLFLAGIVDIFRRAYWPRGSILIGLSVILILFFAYAWAQAEQNFMERMDTANSSLKNPVETPWNGSK